MANIDLIKIGEETDVTLEDVVKEHRDRDERNLENFYKVRWIVDLKLKIKVKHSFWDLNMYYLWIKFNDDLNGIFKLSKNYSLK